jgi:cyclopropane fatty-acyl-phospholipid synthase-like methyltransferase
MKKPPEVIPLYEAEADYWLNDRAKSTFSERKYLDWVVENTGGPRAILDLGCGDGWPIAAYFIDKGFSVTGVDGSGRMIEKAKKRFPKQKWIVEDMRNLHLGKRFEAIIAWDSFFHLSQNEQSSMFQVFQNHLSTNGCLLFTSGPSHGEKIGVLNGKELYHASLSPEEYRALFTKFGLQEIAYDPEDTDCGSHTVWRCKRMKSCG